MKMTILSTYIVSALLIAGCYNGSENGTVRITLGNLQVAENVKNTSFIDKALRLFTSEVYASAIPGNIIKIHAAAMDGDTILVNKSFKQLQLPIAESF